MLGISGRIATSASAAVILASIGTSLPMLLQPGLSGTQALLWIARTGVFAALTGMSILYYHEWLGGARLRGLSRTLTDMVKRDRPVPLATDGRHDEITRLTGAVNQLVALTEAARIAERGQAGFAALVSHEIRTPLSGVLASIDLLSACALPAPADRQLVRLANAARVLSRIVDDVLEFASIDQGQIDLAEAELDLGDFMADVADIYRPQAESKGLHISTSVIPDSVQGNVIADPVRLQQVLGNLIGNAVKFTKVGGIAITAEMLRADGITQLWRISVQDSGIGISESARSRLFEPFRQADGSIARIYGGTGLGLAICRRIVTALGGTIGVDSLPGAGSTFWFELPLSVACRTAPAREPARFAAGGRSLRVLLAEDNDLVRELMTEMLEQAGHSAVCVANGRDAVTMAAAQRFDVVLMDLRMPEMDGSTAAMAIRKLGGARSWVPILALSADSGSSLRDLQDMGIFDAFMTKPFSSAKLLEVLALLPGHAPRDLGDKPAGLNAACL